MSRTKLTFFPRRHPNGSDDGHTKRCSTSLIVGEMQIKTTMRRRLTPVRMAAIKERSCRGEGALTHCQREWRLLQPLEFPRKIKNRATVQASNLGIPPKEMKTGYSGERCTPMLIAALSTTDKMWKHPRCLSTAECRQRT